MRQGKLIATGALKDCYYVDKEKGNQKRKAAQDDAKQQTQVPLEPTNKDEDQEFFNRIAAAQQFDEEHDGKKARFRCHCECGCKRRPGRLVKCCQCGYEVGVGCCCHIEFCDNGICHVQPSRRKTRTSGTRRNEKKQKW